MTQDEIIEMAEACGLTRTHTGEIRLWLSNANDLNRFAKLVAKKAYLEGVNSGISAEREACAMVCEQQADEAGGQDWYISGCIESAKAIRARGEA